jgi:hypothetical protein
MQWAMLLRPHGIVIGSHGNGGELDYPGGTLGLALTIVAGVLLINGVVFYFVFRLLAKVRAATRARIAELEAAGIVARSGRGWMTMLLANYSGPGRRVGVGYYKSRGEMILTEQGLTIVGLSLQRAMVSTIEFDLAHLAKCRAWVESNTLHVATSEPPVGTGNVEIHCAFDRAAAMCEQLSARGCKPQ